MDYRFINLLNEYFGKEFDQLKNGAECNHLYDIWKRAEQGYDDENQMREDAMYIFRNQKIHNFLIRLLLASYVKKTGKHIG